MPLSTPTMFTILILKGTNVGRAPALDSTFPVVSCGRYNGPILMGFVLNVHK